MAVKGARIPAKRPSPIDAPVGRNVRIWRMARGLSQAQLANRLGITFQQLQKYEVGANRIADARAFRLAHAFAAIKDSSFRLSLVNLVEKIAATVPQRKRDRQ